MYFLSMHAVNFGKISQLKCMYIKISDEDNLIVTVYKILQICSVLLHNIDEVMQVL